MNKNKIPGLLCIAAIFILAGFQKNKTVKISVEDKWSGKVSWQQKITGTDPQTRQRYFSEWRMDATINNDTGTVVQTYVSDHPGISCQCRKENYTELEIDLNEQTYSIFVPAEGCYGTCNDHGETKDFGVSDQTGIGINNQPVKDSKHPLNDSKHLSSTLVTDTTYADGTRWYELYTWRLSKSK